jgi:methyl-accepting chemotaxis protein
MKKIRLKIKQKIQVYILLTAVLVYLLAIGYISISARNNSFNDAVRLVDDYSMRYATEVENSLNADMAVIRTLAQAFLTYRNLEEEQWKSLFMAMYGEVFKGNPEIYSIWDSWELSNLDPEWDRPYGRYVVTWWRENNQVKSATTMRSMDGDPELYSMIKNAGVEMIWEPYMDQIVEGKAETNLMTTLSVPLMEGNNYIGLVAADITLESLQNMVGSIRPFDRSFAFLVSNGGRFASHPNKNYLEKLLSDHYTEADSIHGISDMILKGEIFSYIGKNLDGEFYYNSYAPVQVGRTNTPWSIGISVPLNVISAQANRSFYISLIVGLAGLLILFTVTMLVARRIAGPVEQVTEMMQHLALGKIDKTMHLKISSGDELEEMGEAFNRAIDGLADKTEFASAIGQNKLDAQLRMASEEDKLGKSLLEMRQNLQKAQEEDSLRKEEDRKRTWSNEGFARFGDILRQNNDNLKVLSENIISKLVKYLDANQGGLFIINDNDKNDVVFDLYSAFAYNRKKYIEKQIRLGEGLVGTCAIEKETIYLTNIPDDYIEVTSGLGDARPSSLLIVPVRLENEVYGVIEIASFNQFEKYEIEFVEKVAESVASTVSSVRINERTKYLLEQSQQQSEEMAAQEEEMRQNLEELQATQEESARKSNEMEGLLGALNSASYMVEYDLTGKIISINEPFLRFLQLRREQVIGTHHSDNMELTKEQKKNYDKFWENLRSGHTLKQQTRININDKAYTLLETYSPIKDSDGEVHKILKIAYDATEFEIKEF